MSNLLGMIKGDIIVIRLKHDITGISYDHYGVYINDQRVIHYIDSKKKEKFDGLIQETDLKTFLRGKTEVSVMEFRERYSKPKKRKIPVPVNIFANVVKKSGGYKMVLAKTALSLLVQARTTVNKKNYNLFSPDETVARAESRLEENNYRLAFNNCEHFAIWCKTGISESHQVNNVVNVMRTVINITDYPINY